MYMRDVMGAHEGKCARGRPRNCSARTCAQLCTFTLRPLSQACHLHHSMVPAHPSLISYPAAQLGIRYSISRITPEQAPKELSEHDFELKVSRAELSQVPGCDSELTLGQD